ncbi:EamA family transporter RarD [Neobacillus kokaensis]|uniref:Transporter n=1 Tax=Neobacillus kokaensis TaxID=2759023 RepID=A0ABQ3N004_9BACI|nr:EamA family transporter RarD [Neobacillus kokaensis]GHH97303.1 transporter [Neobacillus kokaensis]
MIKNETQLGALYAGFSYFIWGLLPIYWKLLDDINEKEILANRIFWSFIFMLLILLFTKKWGLFLYTIKGFARNKKQLYALIFASIMISGNWYIYIWAVNNGHIVDSSLGYYINPLVSILLGMIVLKEKLSLYQYISFGLAAIGVLIITISLGRFPWIAIALALSFGLYGLVKKMINVDSSVGLALETLAITPVAVIYMVHLFVQGTNAFQEAGVGTIWLLIGGGAATAVPLLYFAKGAQKIPLSLLGFLQYIAPTLMLLLGIFVYHEHFSKVQLISFLFIWSALMIYSLSKTKFLSEKRLKENQAL